MEVPELIEVMDGGGAKRSSKKLRLQIDDKGRVYIKIGTKKVILSDSLLKFKRLSAVTLRRLLDLLIKRRKKRAKRGKKGVAVSGVPKLISTGSNGEYIPPPGASQIISSAFREANNLRAELEALKSKAIEAPPEVKAIEAPPGTSAIEAPPEASGPRLPERPAVQAPPARATIAPLSSSEQDTSSAPQSEDPSRIAMRAKKNALLERYKARHDRYVAQLEPKLEKATKNSKEMKTAQGRENARKKADMYQGMIDAENDKYDRRVNAILVGGPIEESSASESSSSVRIERSKKSEDDRKSSESDGNPLDKAKTNAELAVKRENEPAPPRVRFSNTRDNPIVIEDDPEASAIANELLGNGSGRTNDSLLGYQVNQIMASDPNYAGVTFVDKLYETLKPHVDEDITNVIVNTLTSDAPPGSTGHYIAIRIDNDREEVCIFDPLADPPSETLMRELTKFLEHTPEEYQIKVNQVRSQRDDSTNCGFHSCLFLERMNSGDTFKTATYYDKIDNTQAGERDAKKFQLAHEPRDFEFK